MSTPLRRRRSQVSLRIFREIGPTVDGSADESASEFGKRLQVDGLQLGPHALTPDPTLLRITVDEVLDAARYFWRALVV
jgi:hypothetical protein